MDDKIKNYLAIVKTFYELKEAELKKRGLTWKQFGELEDLAKANWQKIATGGYVDLGDGLIATGTEKELRVWLGTGKVIGHDLHISIHRRK